MTYHTAGYLRSKALVKEEEPGLEPQSLASLKQPHGRAVFVHAGLTCRPDAGHVQEGRMSELPALCQPRARAPGPHSLSDTHFRSGPRVHLPRSLTQQMFKSA